MLKRLIIDVLEDGSCPPDSSTANSADTARVLTHTKDKSGEKKKINNKGSRAKNALKITIQELVKTSDFTSN